MERNSGEMDNDYHGRSGVGEDVSEVFALSVFFLFCFFTRVSNDVDTM